MGELRPWLARLFRRPVRLINGGLLMLVTLISGIGLLALSGWFITATALTGLLLAAGVQASINLYVPGGGIRFFAVSRTIGRYLERPYNPDPVLLLLRDIRMFLFRQVAGQAGGRGGAERGRPRGRPRCRKGSGKCPCAGICAVQSTSIRRISSNARGGRIHVGLPPPEDGSAASGGWQVLAL